MILLRIFSREETAAPGAYAILLGANLVSALGIALLVSGKVWFIPPDVATFLILYLTWIALGVTACRLGADQLAFAILSRDSDVRLHLPNYFLGRLLPLSLAFSFGCAFLFGVGTGLLATLIVIADAYSSIYIASLNARRRQLGVGLATLMNYPLFFGITYVWSLAMPVSALAVAMIFVVTSLARLLWLRLGMRILQSGATRIEVRQVGIRLGLQQAGNYLLFRLDQVMIPVLLLGTLLAQPAADSPALGIATYLYLAKFPELLSTALVLLGAVVYPRLALPGSQVVRQGLALLASHVPMVVLGCLSIVATFVFYRWLFGSHMEVRILDQLPFVLHAMLVFPANLLTYSMLRDEAFNALLRSLTMALIIGAVMLAVLVPKSGLQGLAWLVPLQLAIYIGLAVSVGWRPSVPKVTQHVA